MSDSTFGSKRNPWIALPGAAVFVALAVGLILAGGGSAASGYGGGSTGGPPCHVSAYVTSCDGKVENLTTTPKKPIAGAGFSVNFTTPSGGDYKITAKRKHHAKKTLSHGVVGTGNVSIEKLGKTLKADKYSLKVKVTNSGKTDVATRDLRIKKP